MYLLQPEEHPLVLLHDVKFVEQLSSLPVLSLLSVVGLHQSIVVLIEVAVRGTPAMEAQFRRIHLSLLLLHVDGHRLFDTLNSSGKTERVPITCQLVKKFKLTDISRGREKLAYRRIC